MFAAKNLLALVGGAGGGAAAQYDTKSSALSGSIASGAVQTIAITAASGADVFLIFTDSVGDTYSNVKCNGVTMTAVSPSPLTHAAFGGNGALYIYRAAGAGTGSSINCTFTPSGSTEYVNAIACSVKNVTGVSASWSNNPSGVSSLSSGSISCPAGSLLLSMMTTGGGPTVSFTGNSGGTNLCQVGYPTTTDNLCVSYGTATTTFSTTASGNGYWAGAVLLLA